MQKIVYKTHTGIAIITPTHGIILAMKDIPRILPADKLELWHIGKMSLQEYAKYPNVEYKIIDESELPQDRKYRNAWNYDLKIDATKKAEIDAEITAAAELAAMPDLVKTMESKISALESKP